tara:strand:+ start:112 stop:588 length:477 start_codon:yes stop_codon:yes gene_type:complete
MADLTVTLTESGTIQGEAVSDSETLTIAGIDSIYHAKLKTTESTADDNGYLYSGNESIALGNGDPHATIKYCRITNVEDTGGTDVKVILADNNFVNLTYYELTPGQSLILYNFDDYQSATSEVSTPPAVDHEIKVIGTYQGSISPAYIEIFMASTYSG